MWFYLGLVTIPVNCTFCDFVPFQPFLASDPLLSLILMAGLGSLQQQDLPTICNGSGSVLLWEGKADTSQIFST